MRVLVLTINYSPEPTGFAPHVAALCEHLARGHHEVVTITGFPFAPFWVRWDHEGRGTIAAEDRKGVRLFRVRHFVPTHPRRVWERLLMEGSYCLLALWAITIRARFRPDVILYVGAQPSISMLARLLGWWRGRPYVVAINDLAAQAAGDVGLVRRSGLVRALRAFEMAAYRRSSAAIVLCRAFREALLADGYPAAQIHIVPSPIDVEQVRPTEDGGTFRDAHGIDRRAFVVLYAGSMGIKQDLHTIVRAARMAVDERDVVWVLVGEGELKAEVMTSVERDGLGRQVRFLPFQEESQMAAMFSAADVLLLSQLAAVKDTVIPSKLLTYMAAGRPVLAAVNAVSEAGRLMADARAGRLVPPEDPQALAAAVLEMRRDPAGRDETGRRNRRYAEANFDARRIVEVQEAILRDVVARNA